MKKFLLILVAIFAFNFQNVYAQDGLKIVTNHPDFKIKVKRCEASGKTVIVDLILINQGVNDVEKIEGYGVRYYDHSEAYDDEGNIYDNIQVKVSNKENYSWESGAFNIPTGVPMKYSVKIEGVPQSAESIARLKLLFLYNGWGLDVNKPVKISNIPISRN